MALSTISLNLKNSQSLQPKQLENTQISSAYTQRPQAELPKVLYQVNTVPIENGIKSTSVFESDFVYNISQNLNTDSIVETPIITDSTGNKGVALIEIGHTLAKTYNMYMRTGTITTGADMLRILSYTNIENVFLTKRYTLFQNKTLLLTKDTDTYHVGVGGDTPLATKNAVMEFNIVSGVLINRNLSGIDLNTIAVQGIVSFENYLVFFNRTTIFWSNPLDFTDFTPAIGGGGNEKIAEARGDIITIVPSANGLTIYCRGNIVLATFSGDTANPWIFNEIPNSSGLQLSNQINNSRPLVTVNEQTQVQYALLDTGLSAVTETNVQPVGESILEYISANYIEDKPQGTSIVNRIKIGTPNFHLNKIQAIYSFGKYLFIILGNSTDSLGINRVLMIDFQSQAYGTIKGDYRSIHERVTFNQVVADNNALQDKPSIMPLNFTLSRKPASLLDRLEPMILDLGSIGDTDMSVDALTDDIAEVLIGQISLSKDRNTIIHSIRLTGRLVRVLESEGGAGPGVDPDTVKVFAFSNTTQTNDTPIEFTYNPADNRYYGYIEGKDIKVLIQGKNFYLTKFEAEVEAGGII